MFLKSDDNTDDGVQQYLMDFIIAYAKCLILS